MTRLILAAALALPAAGCGDAPGKRPVSGTVTWNGRPLQSGLVRFVPAAGPGDEAAAVVSGGRFAVPAAGGLSPGRYKVVISSPDPKAREPVPPGTEEATPPAKERLPAKYNRQTELTAEVSPDGENAFAFDLK